MGFTWKSYSGSVLQEKEGYLFDHDVMKGHIVGFIKDNLGTITVGSGSATEVTFWGDYPIAENLKLPTCVISIQHHEEINEYVGNFLFEHIDSASGLAASGSADMVYGAEKAYIIRIDVWSRSPWIRDIVAGKVENLFQWHRTARSNIIYDLGIKQVRTLQSEIIGFDDSDRYIKDVSYHNGNIMVYRRYLDLFIRADVRFIPPDDVVAEDLLVGEVDLETFLTSGGTMEDILTESGTHESMWSGTFSGS